jgi:hypothetical protein
LNLWCRGYTASTPVVLRIEGTGFLNPLVFIGGELCPLHNASSPGLIFCELPPGTVTDLSHVSNRTRIWGVCT